MRIGTFHSTGKGFAGIIDTLTIKAELTLEPNRSERPGAPDFNVFRGTTEVGYAYQKTSDGGVEYISCKIDDPSLPYPIYASLFTQSKTEELALTWSRPKKK